MDMIDIKLFVETVSLFLYQTFYRCLLDWDVCIEYVLACIWWYVVYILFIMLFIY